MLVDWSSWGWRRKLSSACQMESCPKGWDIEGSSRLFGWPTQKSFLPFLWQVLISLCQILASIRRAHHLTSKAPFLLLAKTTTSYSFSILSLFEEETFCKIKYFCKTEFPKYFQDSNIYSLIPYYVPGTIRGVVDIKMNEIRRISVHRELIFQWRRETHRLP